MTRRHHALLASLAVACAVAPAPASAQQASGPPTLTVTGRGTVEARPDRVDVRYGIEQVGATREEARGGAARKARSLLGRLRKIGVDPVGVRISDVSVGRRASRPGLRKPFLARAQVAARSTRLDLASRMLDLGPPLGVDVDGPGYALVDDTAALEQATTVAVGQAQRRAAVTAAGLGRTLAGIRSVSLDNAFQIATVAPQSAAPAQGREDGPPTPTAPGTVSVASSVTVVYDLG